MPGTDEAGAANVNGGGLLAACAAALSDDVLEVLYRTVDGGDPGGKSRDELVAWLSAMPDEASTRERILAVTKFLEPSASGVDEFANSLSCPAAGGARPALEPW